MSEYTVEDFAQARFAEHPDTGQTACRIAGADGSAWTTEDGADATDASMARDRWVPVVEATEVMQNRQIDAEAHLDQIERLSKQLAVADKQIKSRRLVLEGLLAENARLGRILQAPLSLKDLEVAWEAAEVPTDDAPMRQGDVYISTVDRNDRGLGYLVAAAGRNGTHMHFNARILSRAQREPWQGLADVLGDFAIHDGRGREYPDVLARLLHERGVRVTGGDDDE